MTWLAQEVLPTVAMLAYFATSMRILMFRRQGRNHCARYSVLASLMIGVTLSAAVEILILKPPVNLGQCVIALAFLFIACRTKGNVAHMMLRAKSCQ